jgi:hypothetical protein
MEDADRLDRLESAINEQQKQGARLEMLLNALQTQLTTPPPPPPKSEPRSPVLPLPIEAKTSKLKPAPPSDFDGNRKKGRVFLNQCELYIRLRKTDFADEATQINWALTYMKSGRAAAFAEELIAYEADSGVPRFDSWRDFRERFEEKFCPLDEATVAVNRLESTAYFQEKRELDDYIDEFDELLRRSGYQDDKLGIVKFRRGLNPKIQDQIACGDDLPTDLKGWKAAARTIDQNRQANDAFQSALGSRVKPATSANTRPGAARSFFNLGQPAKDSASTSPLRPSVASAPPAPGAQKPKYPPGSCFRCGSLEHFSRQCPHNHDIRYMTPEEKQEWICQILADEDAKAGVEQPADKEEKEEKEDFVPRSG